MREVMLFSLFNNALIFCLNKWKVIEKYEYYKKSIMPDWCTFCFFFWCGMIEYLLFVFGDVVNLYYFVQIFFFAMCIAFTSSYINKTYYAIDRL